MLSLRSPDPLRFSLAMLALSLCQAGAVGFRLPNQDPEAIARGNAFAATADNPSAIFYNPAGISQLDGDQLSIGVYAISADLHYHSFTGATASSDTSIQEVPQIYYTHKFKDTPFTFGMGFYAPYGLGVKYGEVSPISTIAQEAKLEYVTANPVISYQVSPTLSVAAGVTINYSDVNLERQIGLGPADGFRFDGNGWGTGFNLGMLWKPVDEWAFGLNYRSPTGVTYEGKSIAFPYAPYSSTKASIDYPQNIVGGISYRPNEKWNFEFDLDWTDWDTVNDATFLGTFGGPQVFPFRYVSSLMYDFGVTRNLDNGYFVSAGYIFSENSVPSKTLTPFNPDSDLQLGSIGFGHHGQCISWAIGYHFAYNGGRTVIGSSAVSPLGQTADGHYTTFNNAVNVSVRYSF